MIQHLVKAGLIRDVHLEPGSLRSLHQLSLWVSTLSLHLLAAVPEFKTRKGPGFSLLHDGESLQLLRYLLAMVRLWNLSKLNIICTEKEMDLTAKMFSMVTRLIKKMEDAKAEALHIREEKKQKAMAAAKSKKGTAKA